MGVNDDGVADFMPESESQSMSAARDSKGQPVLDDEQRQQRHERKELEKMSMRFKVITPAEFERTLSLQENGERPISDSWAGGPQPKASDTDIPEGKLDRPDQAMPSNGA